MENEYRLEKEKRLGKRTLTVQELIKILEKYPKEMKIFTTWESTLHSLEKENIYKSSTGSLYLDADQNFYKDDFCCDLEEDIDE